MTDDDQLLHMVQLSLERQGLTFGRLYSFSGATRQRFKIPARKLTFLLRSLLSLAHICSQTVHALLQLSMWAYWVCSCPSLVFLLRVGIENISSINPSFSTKTKLCGRKFSHFSFPHFFRRTYRSRERNGASAILSCFRLRSSSKLFCDEGQSSRVLKRTTTI